MSRSAKVFRRPIAEFGLKPHPDTWKTRHMADVTREAVHQMGISAVKNILSAFDGAPIKKNAVKPEVFEK